MRKILLFLSLSFFLGFSNTQAQNAVLEGYVFESNNRGYLNLVKVTIKEKVSQQVLEKIVSNREGFFTTTLPLNQDFELLLEKDVFQDKVVEVSTKGIQAGEKIYTKAELLREDGYLFDVTMAEKWDGQSQVDAIQGALVEIYNNTTDKEELVLKDHPNPTFSFTFDKGNHYTVMIRKEGYFTKRMEAYVDVDGCILCFDGLDEISPGAVGASDNLTAGHEMGTIVSNVELVPIKINESITINNIYYDLGKWDIRDDAAKELDKLIVTLRDNPSLIVELGSHTDARGKDDFNLRLSQKRAKSAVDYIRTMGEINAARITAKGYGETKLVNSCKNGVDCSERKHQQNRRTELKIVGLLQEDPFDGRSLAQIIKAEKFDEMLAEIENQEVIEIKEGDELPPELKAQIEADLNKDNASDFTASAEVSTDNGTTSIIQNTPEIITNTIVETPSSSPVKEEIVTFTPPQQEVTPPSSVPPKNNPVPSEESINVIRSEGNVIRSEIEEDGSIDGFDTDFEFVEESENVAEDDGRTFEMQNEYEIDKTIISRPPKQIATNYSGYKIEFYNSPYELPQSHVIFSKHGNISIEQKKNGSFAYLLGDFKSRDAAFSFLRDVMDKLYPGSMLIQYENGKRR